MMFNINPKNSYLIGDKDSDIQAGEKVELKGIKISENQSLLEIVKKIVQNHI